MTDYILKDEIAQLSSVQAKEQEHCGEMVHVETLHQVMWERDIAIGQLKELGYEFGQKIEPCEDAISRADLGLTDFEIVMCNGDYKQALEMLIDKIQKAPSVVPKPNESQDAISRLDKIRQIIAIPNSVIQEDVLKYKMICEVLNDKFGNEYELPFVQPSRKGRWIRLDDYHMGKFECSECHTLGYVNTCMYEPKWNFCPNCGCRMVGDTDAG